MRVWSRPHFCGHGHGHVGRAQCGIEQSARMSCIPLRARHHQRASVESRPAVMSARDREERERWAIVRLRERNLSARRTTDCILLITGRRHPR